MVYYMYHLNHIFKYLTITLTTKCQGLTQNKIRSASLSYCCTLDLLITIVNQSVHRKLEDL